MSCLAPPPSTGEHESMAKLETEYSDGEPRVQLRSLQRRNSQVLAALALLSALVVALLGVSIAAIVTAKHAQSDVGKLEAAYSPGSNAGTSAAAGGGSSGSGATGAVYVSDSPQSPEGYLPAGSLYRGSGYWSNSSSNLPTPRSHFAAISLPAAANDSRVFLLGGLDGSGVPTDSVVAYDALLDLYTSLAPLPGPRASLAAAAVDANTIVVVGGYKDAASMAAKAPESCVLTYNISANTWASDCSNSGVPLADACAAATNNNVYVVGGIEAGGQLSKDIRFYNPTSKAWETATTLPSARSGAACAAADGLVYIAGGQGADGSLLDDFMSYEPATAAVKALSPPAYGSGDVELVALPGGSLLSIGGIANTSAPGVQAPTHYAQEYLPAADSWVQKAPIALARLRAGAAYANGGVYAFGGLQRCTAPQMGDSCPERPIADVEVFYDVSRPSVFVHLKDPAASNSPDPPASKVLLLSDTAPQPGYTSMGLLHAGSGYWAAEELLPVPALADHAVVAVGNSIYIIGGMLPGNQTLTADVWEFDTLLSTYTRRAPMPAPRSRAGAAALGGKIYVAGGYASATETEGPQGLFVYDIQADKWTASDAKLNVPRSDACMAAVDGRLYLGGGYSTNYTETLSSVEVMDPEAATWTLLEKPMPTPRGDVMCTSFTLGGVEQYVVVGGYWDPANAWTVGAFRREVEAYNPVAADWTSLEPIPQARGDNALVTLPGNRMLVLGGETDSSATSGSGAAGRNQVATNGADLYLADYNTWVPMAPMAEPRFRFDAAYANGFVYVFGGATTSICSSDGATCTARGGAQTASKYMDISYPDVFVFMRE